MGDCVSREQHLDDLAREDEPRTRPGTLRVWVTQEAVEAAHAEWVADGMPLGPPMGGGSWEDWIEELNNERAAHDELMRNTKGEGE